MQKSPKEGNVNQSHMNAKARLQSALVLYGNGHVQDRLSPLLKCDDPSNAELT